ncbi:transcriptional regulator [Actinospica acidiphila]|uniref:Transcriptional regulator n=1 Tax=Actinospica acidiphila TaxID=304899 RepID=A0A9X5HB83_9ACTN|nr:type IV toxin-antitoxin system AbiEi family antitoxin domain-containing protein [Actinospica acidiphila]NEC48365.1 transcriptional regulator [Actinospica acidiphila]
MERAEQLAILSGVAADQWGLVTAAQAKAHGLSAVQLKRLTEVGLLENVGRGVYALPAAGLPRHLEIKVAWLRLQPAVPAWERPIGGPDSGVISRASACQLHSLGDIPAPDVEISVPRRRTTTEPFVRLRTADLPAADITMVDGLPVTTPARTIIDLLRANTDGGHVGGVIADAERRDLVDVKVLAQAVQPYVRKYGLRPAATGYELVEHLVGQAGRTLHAQEVARAGEDGLVVGAELGVRRSAEILAPYLNAEAYAAAGLKPYLAGQLQAARSIGPLFRTLTEQQAAARAALDAAVPEILSSNALRALQELQDSPAFKEALKHAMPSSHVKEVLQQAGVTKGLLPPVQALKMPSVLSLESRRALQGHLAMPRPAAARAVRALQQPDASQSDYTDDAARHDDCESDEEHSNESNDKPTSH